jgi:hypothetical protein
VPVQAELVEQGLPAPPGARPSSLDILQHRNAESDTRGYFKPNFFNGIDQELT